MFAKKKWELHLPSGDSSLSPYRRGRRHRPWVALFLVCRTADWSERTSPPL